MKPYKFIKTCSFYIWEESFAIVKARKTCSDAFATIVDKNEITLVIEQRKVNQKEVIEIEKNWKILTFDVVLPFDLVGFLATISKALAKERIPIYSISAYSTDHILIKKINIVKAKETLKKLGCKLVKDKVSATHSK